MQSLRPCRPEDRQTVLDIVNEAARKYEGAIPDDCWRWPYMRAEELEREIAAGVAFSGLWAQDRLSGVMGIQDRGDVALIRHAYVLPSAQGSGIGGRLLEHVCAGAEKTVLVGTWAAAEWAISFYERRGFVRQGTGEVPRLLAAYWSVPARQAQASVVLSRGAPAVAGPIS